MKNLLTSKKQRVKIWGCMNNVAKWINKSLRRRESYSKKRLSYPIKYLKLRKKQKVMILLWMFIKDWRFWWRLKGKSTNLRIVAMNRVVWRIWVGGYTKLRVILKVKPFKKITFSFCLTTLNFSKETKWMKSKSARLRDKYVK